MRVLGVKSGFRSSIARQIGKLVLVYLIYRREGWRGVRKYWKALRGGSAPYADMLRTDPGIAFDADYYRQNSRTVREWHVEPWRHYVLFGSKKNRRPHPLFDPEYYLKNNDDVREQRLDPFLHYVMYGMKEARAPSALFDPEWYLSRNKDVSAEKLDPFVHYVQHGQREGRVPLKPGGGGGPIPPYEAWQRMNELSVRDRSELQTLLNEHKGSLPKISLITPVYNTDPSLFEDMVGSVLGQIYQNWELCLVDDASPSAYVSPMLDRAAARDGRIKIKRLTRNGGISVATNVAVEVATGEVVAFLDHDDLLTPDCLAELALYYGNHPDADIVYSDDDKADMSGKRYAPQFKPDWSPTLLLSFMYMSHIFSVRRSLFQKLGGFRKQFDGSQDYDFALRAAEVARHVGHIPKILYHWRAAPGSTAQSADAKPASVEAGRLAVQQAVERRGYAADAVVQADWAIAARCGVFDIRFVDDGPSVTLIIPTKNQLGYLKTCIDSLRRTTYRNYDVLVVDNESDDPATIGYLATINKIPGIRVTRIGNIDGQFSYSALNNAAVRECKSEYILFLNNDTEVIAPGWLSQMMGYVRMPDVGAVGARLYFEDGTIQHAGIVHGYNEGLVGHAFRNHHPNDSGYMGFIRTAREYSGVTAACMVTPRRLFEELGGFDEKNFAVAYSDVDYCYRVIKAGRTCVYCPSAELYHFEGKSRGFKDNPRERANLRLYYGEWRDRWYNPNLTLEHENFEPAAIRSETRQKGPLRAVIVSHNLNHEGAPSTLMDLTIGLTQQGVIAPHVVSPNDGPLRARYEAAGIPVTILDYVPLHGIPTDRTYNKRWIDDGNLAFGRWLKAMEAEVVLANTLITYWAITGAAAVGIPSIWCQHESEPFEYYYDYLPPEIRSTAYGAFKLAYRVLYVAEATRASWRALDERRTFQVIRHGIPLDRLAEEVGRWSKREARSNLGIDEDEIVVEIIGTVCPRKGQIDLVQAFALLPAATQRRLRVFLAGHIGDAGYAKEIEAAVAALPAETNGRVILTGAMEDPFLYYAAADIAVCSSRIESAPRVIVEAMACGLPIVTTPVFGIPELVDEGVNAVFYEPGNAADLAEKLSLLIANDQLRTRLASRSRAVLDSQPGFNEMVTAYAHVLRSAVNLQVEPSMVDDGRKVADVKIKQIGGNSDVSPEGEPDLHPAKDIYRFFSALDRSQDLADVIVDSGFFDPSWYQDRYMRGTSQQPIEHYIKVGIAKNYNPSQQFSSNQYYEHYDDVKRLGVPAFFHFLMLGSLQRRIYFPFIEGSYKDVRAQMPDLSDVREYRRGGVAVVAHVFYPDIWDELKIQIDAIPQPNNLFISLVRGQSDHLAARLLEDFPTACIKIFPNHGRDVFPFTEFLNAGAFDGCELLCKLHTKKSLHRDDGAYWRKALYTELLGSPNNVENIIEAFRCDGSLGIFVPDGQRESYMGVNENHVRALLDRIKLPLDLTTMVFPAGNMFWIRGSCLSLLKALNIRYDEFEFEAGQLDGTVGHAFERVVGVVCAAQGNRILTTSDIDSREPAFGDAMFTAKA